MNTIVAFFVGVMSFFLGLFGIDVNNTQPAPEAQQPGVAISSSTQSSSASELSPEGNRPLFQKELNSTKYKIKDGKVFYIDSISSDSPTFVALDANPETFEVVSDTEYTCSTLPVAKDDKKVFIGDRIIDGVDVLTFQVIDFYMSKDKNNVYRLGERVPVAHVSSFKQVEGQRQDTCDGGYTDFYEDINNYYCFPYGDIVTLDRKDVIYLNDDYIKYRNELYVGCIIPYKTQSTATTSFMDMETIQPVLGTNSYLKDKKDVYYHLGGTETDEFFPIGADPKTFEVFSSGYSRDGLFLYFALNREKARFANSDPDTFKVLNEIYAKDKINVYVKREPNGKGGNQTSWIIHGASPDSFEVLSGGEYGYAYAKDDSHVYYYDMVIPEIDPKSVRLFKNRPDIIADDVSVYTVSSLWIENPFTKIKDIDAKTFSVSGAGIPLSTEAFDKNGRYRIESSDFSGTTIIKIKSN